VFREELADPSAVGGSNAAGLTIVANSDNGEIDRERRVRR